jgi:hypothetical protein
LKEHHTVLKTNYFSKRFGLCKKKAMTSDEPARGAVKRMNKHMAAGYLMSRQMSPVEQLTFREGVMDIPEGVVLCVDGLPSKSAVEILDLIIPPAVWEILAESITRKLTKGQTVSSRKLHLITPAKAKR